MSNIQNDEDHNNLFTLEDFDQNDFVHLGEVDDELDLAALLAAADELDTQPLTSDELKTRIATTQQLSSANTIERDQFWSKPLNYFASDQNILESLQQLSEIETETHLFQSFVDNAGVELLLGLISHDNLSIAIASIEIILAAISTEHNLIPSPEPQILRDPTFSTPCSQHDLAQHHQSTPLEFSQFGSGWIIIFSIIQLRGLNVMFNLILLLDDSIKAHRALTLKFFDLIELLLENELCFHSLLQQHLIPFLMIRIAYNDKLFQQATRDNLEEFKHNNPTQSTLTLKLFKVDTVVAVNLPPNQPKLHHFNTPMESLHGMKTNRLYAAELLSLIATIDPYCFTQYITSTPFSPFPVLLTPPTPTTSSTSQPALKFPSYDLIFRNTIHSKEELLVHPLFNPKLNYFNSLLGMYQHCIDYYSTISTTSAQILSEVGEFVNNLASCIKSCVSETRLHHSMSFGSLQTSLLLYSNTILNKHNYHPRFMFFALQGVQHIILPGLRSRLLLPTLSIFEASIDCDFIQQSSSTINSIDSTNIIDNTEYQWGIIVDEFINKNGLGMIFGYLQTTPSLPLEESQEFQSTLISSLLHLILNASSTQQVLNNTNPAPLTRLVHKFVQNQHVKIVALIQQLSALFQPLYAGIITSHPELEQVFGVDVYLGYSTHISQAQSLSTSIIETIPDHLSLIPVHTTEDGDKISCLMQHLAVYRVLLKAHQLPLITKFSTIVLALYTILLSKEMNQYTDNVPATPLTLSTFVYVFQQANIHPVLLFNLVGESRYYAGNSTFGKQLGLFLEYFAPFVDSYQE